MHLYINNTIIYCCSSNLLYNDSLIIVLKNIIQRQFNIINTTIILIFSDDFTNIKLSTFKDLVAKLRTFKALKMEKCKLRTFKDPYEPW